MATKTVAQVEPHVRFRACASTHGLRLHRIHMLASGKAGALQSTVVFDCSCGQRWLTSPLLRSSVVTGVAKPPAAGTFHKPEVLNGAK